jgi:imidazolonepropionase
MSILIQNPNQIVTAASSPARGPALKKLHTWHDCSLLIRNESIEKIAPAAEMMSMIDEDTLIIDARGKTVMPGFVDSHTHLIFAGTREGEFELRIQGASYAEIAAQGGGIVQTVLKTRAADKGELMEIAQKYLTMALQHGTTTMEVKSGYGLDLENEMKILDVIHELDRSQPIDLIPTFMGAHAVPPGRDKNTYIQEILAMLPITSQKARFCDVFCEKGYFDVEQARCILQEGLKFGLVPRLHADQLSNNNSVQMAVKLHARSVDHLELISESEIGILSASDTCATLLPGVPFFLNYGYPPARKIIDSGCIMALASNFNPGSCMTLNMQLILTLACTHMSMTPDEAIIAATANGAYALGLENTGVIRPGLQADILILDVPNFLILPYFFGFNHVETVIKEGNIVWKKE